MAHRAGFVNIIGKPNAGKSTLLNQLIGEELAIATPKAQTTRHRIKGILNSEDYQIIFSDTPGILKPAYKLHEKMMDLVEGTFADADVMVLLVTPKDHALPDEIVKKLKSLKVPLLIAINKIDLTDQKTLEEENAHWDKVLKPQFMIPISALENFHVEELKQAIVKLLPLAEAYFPKDELSDKNLRFFASEYLREQILNQFEQEIPYSVEVAIEEFKEEGNLYRIKAFIFVSRESQKAIILGKGGASIKRVGTEARKKMEAFYGKKVFLETTVKVKENWRDSDSELKRFGYEN